MRDRLVLLVSLVRRSSVTTLPAKLLASSILFDQKTNKISLTIIGIVVRGVVTVVGARVCVIGLLVCVAMVSAPLQP